MGQNLRYLFGDDYPPKIVYFKGFWDVHWGTGVLTHSHLFYSNYLFLQKTKEMDRLFFSAGELSPGPHRDTNVALRGIADSELSGPQPRDWCEGLFYFGCFLINVSSFFSTFAPSLSCFGLFSSWFISSLVSSFALSLVYLCVGVFSPQKKSEGQRIWRSSIGFLMAF